MHRYADALTYTAAAQSKHLLQTVQTTAEGTSFAVSGREQVCMYALQGQAAQPD